MNFLIHCTFQKYRHINFHSKFCAHNILLRNFNSPRMCNGTRFSVKKFMLKVIKAAVLNEKSKGEDVLIPRLPVLPIDMLFEYKRLQFPFRLVFSMTNNKAQGQSLQVCGLNFENLCFAHGQLYVYMFASGKSHKIIHFCARWKKNCVCQSTSINN